MSMSSAGRAASSSDCVGRPRALEIGLSGFAVQIRPSSLTGSYAMATAEHREPYESRGSRTVLGAPGGESPPGDSTIASILTCPRYVRLAGNSGNVDWLLNGSTLGVIHLVYAPTSIRIRHPSFSPARDRQQPVSRRWPSPPTGGSTIRLGDVATAVAVPGVAFRAARITRGWATSPREAHWLDFLAVLLYQCYGSWAFRST